MSWKDWKYLGFLISLVVCVFFCAAVIAQSVPTIDKVKQHIKDACSAAWPNGTAYEIDHCIERGMAAMGEMEGLRIDELKRSLIDCEEELEELEKEKDGTK